MPEPRSKIGDINIWCGFDELADIESLKPHPRNDNTHPKEQIRKLADIITANGFRESIKVSTLSGCITKGHGRWMAAQKLGMTSVPVEHQYYANEVEEIADIMAGNRVTRLSIMDFDKSLENMKLLKIEAISLRAIGMDDKEFDRALKKLDFGGSETKDRILENGLVYQIILECMDENHQADLLTRFEKENIKCRPLIS